MQSKCRGFTLLEILIALFIFTIISMILATALRSVIDAQVRTERNAERLRQLQMALLILSRDITQTINRPVLLATGKEEPAFVGSTHRFTFTHTGYANANQSTLQRVAYSWHDEVLWRMSWNGLDQAPNAEPSARRLLTDVVDLRFQYLDKKGRLQNNWPVSAQSKEPLPRAVKIILTLSSWGELSQLYVISTQTPDEEMSAKKST